MCTTGELDQALTSTLYPHYIQCNEHTIDFVMQLKKDETHRTCELVGRFSKSKRNTIWSTSDKIRIVKLSFHVLTVQPVFTVLRLSQVLRSTWERDMH